MKYRAIAALAGTLVAAAVVAACSTGDVGSPTSESPQTGNGKTPGSNDPSQNTGAPCATYPACQSIALPASPHAIRLTHMQWENATRDLLHLAAPSGLSATFPADPAPPHDKQAQDSGALVVSSTLWSEYQHAAESLADLVVTSATNLAAILPASAQAGTDEARALAFITDFLPKVFRRPATQAEIDAYVALGGSAVANATASEVTPDSFALRVRWVLTAALQSPSFLYRVEGGQGEVKDGRLHLAPYEMAAKLSFALWGTTPDANLLALAASGKLTTAADVAALAKSMLADPRADQVITDFHDQLYAIGAYPGVIRSTTSFPNYYPEFGKDAQEDTRRTLADVLASGGGVSALHQTNVAYVNARLAHVYGIDPTTVPALVSAPTAFTRVELDKGTRSGILTHVGWLAYESHSQDPASILRGAYMARHVMCIPLGSPPPEAAGKDPSQFSGNTNRARITAMTGTCGATCHGKTINPLGFGFEKFDALGQLRLLDNGDPVDATGTNSDLGTYDGAIQEMTAVASNPRVHACYAAHWASYLNGFATVDVQSAWLAPILAHSMQGASVRDLIVDLVQTDSFTTVVPAAL